MIPDALLLLEVAFKIETSRKFENLIYTDFIIFLKLTELLQQRIICDILTLYKTLMDS